MTSPGPVSPWAFPPPDAATRVSAAPPEVWPPLPLGPGPGAEPPRTRGRTALAVALVAVLALIGGLLVGRVAGRALDGIDSSAGSRPTLAPPDTSGPSDTSGSTPPATDLPQPRREATEGSFTVGVVDIDTTLGYERSSASGSGMIISTDGAVLTNYHVVDGATGIQVTVVSTGRTYDATVVGSEEDGDVALLQLADASGLTPVTLGSAATLDVGDPLVSVGNAGGDGGTPTVARGTVRGLDRSITATNADGTDPSRLTGLIVTDARMQPGMSGGPLFDGSGAVVGMNTAGSRTSGRRVVPGETDSFAITIDKALAVVEQIRSGEETDTVQIGPHGFLGVEISPDDPATPGAVIGSILGGTPASRTELTAGDVIVSVDDAPVDSAARLGELLEARDPGDEVRIGWVDASGNVRSATVTLIAAPA